MEITLKFRNYYNPHEFIQDKTFSIIDEHQYYNRVNLVYKYLQNIYFYLNLEIYLNNFILNKQEKLINLLDLTKEYIIIDIIFYSKTIANESSYNISTYLFGIQNDGYLVSLTKMPKSIKLDFKLDLEISSKIINIFSTKENVVILLEDGQAIINGGFVHLYTTSKQLYLNNIKHIVKNDYAFAFLTFDNIVYTFGCYHWGGTKYMYSSFTNADSTITSGLPNVKYIYSSRTLFIAITFDDEIITWGCKTTDFNEIFHLKDIKKIICNNFAFAALLNTGKVITWGDIENGGLYCSQLDKLLIDVIDIFPRKNGFLAIKINNQILEWEKRSIIEYTDVFDKYVLVTDQIFIYDYSIIIIKKNENKLYMISKLDKKTYACENAVASHGACSGVVSSSTCSSLLPYASKSYVLNIFSFNFSSEIIKIVKTHINYEFIALLSNGTIIRWVIINDNFIEYFTKSILTDIINIVVSDNKFIALNNKGQVYVWNELAYGKSYDSVEINNSYQLLTQYSDIISILSNDYNVLLYKKTGEIIILAKIDIHQFCSFGYGNNIIIPIINDIVAIYQV